MGKKVVTALSKSSMVILFIITAAAISLSVLSYQYSEYTANVIGQNAVNAVQHDTERQASDIRGILINKINTVVSNLHVIADAPVVVRGEDEDELEARVLFNTAGATIGRPLDFVAWLDSDGRLVWSSNVNATTWNQYAGIDLSSRPYFTEARDTREPYFSSVIESVDNIPRVFMSVPIVDSSDEFKGIVYAGYRLDQAAELVEEQAIGEDSESTVLLLSKEGVLLHSPSSELVGRNLLSEEVQSQFIPSSIPAAEKEKVDEVLRRALNGESGSADVTINGITNTVAFEPVTINGSHFMTLFVLTPHVFASDTMFMINQQQNVSIIIVALIGAVSLSMALIVLGWNKKLRAAVDARTAELQQANDRLVEGHKLQKEFVNIAAHELRTPLQPLLGIVEQLEEEVVGKHQEEFKITKPEVEMLARNTKRLTRLTSDLLDVSRIESNSLKLKKERIDLQEKVKRVIEDSKSFIDNGRKVDIVFEPSTSSPVIVEADRLRMFEVLSNIIRNAINFTKEGVITVRLDQTDDDYAQISVKDTGSGIDPGIFPKLFTKFASKSDTGTGLGLFITKSIIALHGGRIWAENNKDGEGGATFTFTLPTITASKTTTTTATSSRIQGEKGSQN